jgi:hypothetical protein
MPKKSAGILPSADDPTVSRCCLSTQAVHSGQRKTSRHGQSRKANTRKAKSLFRPRYGNSLKKPGIGQPDRFCRFQSGNSLEASLSLPGQLSRLGIPQVWFRILSAWSGQQGRGESRSFPRWIAPNGSKYRKPCAASIRGRKAFLLSYAKSWAKSALRAEAVNPLPDVFVYFTWRHLYSKFRAAAHRSNRIFGSCPDTSAVIPVAFDPSKKQRTAQDTHAESQY